MCSLVRAYAYSNNCLHVRIRTVRICVHRRQSWELDPRDFKLGSRRSWLGREVFTYILFCTGSMLESGLLSRKGEEFAQNVATNGNFWVKLKFWSE